MSIAFVLSSKEAEGKTGRWTCTMVNACSCSLLYIDGQSEIFTSQRFYINE